MNRPTIKRIEIDVAPPRGAADEFLAVWANAGSASVSATPRITFETADQMHSAISEKRLELMRAVAATPELNMKALAERLQRDYKNVHTDVTMLVELGLLERAADGSLTAPFDEIVIHAQIRAAA